MVNLCSVYLYILALVQPLVSETAQESKISQISPLGVRTAINMDKNITTIENYKQYLQTIQRIYLKQSYILPIDQYTRKSGIKVRNFFRDTKPEMAMPAACIPQLTTVPIHLDQLPPGSFIFPTCTRVERCGGCCSHPLLSCQPTETEQVLRDMLVIDINSDRRMTANLTRHVSCACDCTTQEEHCGPNQDYYPEECKCECSNWTDQALCKGRHKLWDSTTCLCRCTNLNTECSTGLQFSRDTCRCEPVGPDLGTTKPPLHGRPNSKDTV